MRNKTYLAHLPPEGVNVGDVATDEAVGHLQRGDPEYERLRTERRRLALDPLPTEFDDWPEYMLALHLAPELLQTSITGGIFTIWRHDAAGRLWLKRTFSERRKSR